MQNGDMKHFTEQSFVFYSLLIKFVSPVLLGDMNSFSEKSAIKVHSHLKRLVSPVLLHSLPKCFVSPVLRGDMNFFSGQSFIFYSLLKKFVSPVTLALPKKLASPINLTEVHP